MSGAGASSRWSYTDGWLTEHRRGDGERTRTHPADPRRARPGAGRRHRRPPAAVRLRRGRPARPRADRRRRAQLRLRRRPAGSSRPTGQHTYSHDAAGQLRTSTGPDGERRFDHDAAGRRTAETGPGRHRGYALGPARPAHRPSPPPPRTGTRTTSLTVDALGELTAVDDTPLDLGHRRPASPRWPPSATQPGHRRRPALGHHRSGPLHPDWQHTVGDDDSTPGVRPPRRRRRSATAANSPSTACSGCATAPTTPAPAASCRPTRSPPSRPPPYAANPYHYAGNDPVNALDPHRPAPGHRRRPGRPARRGRRRRLGLGQEHASDIGHGALDVVGLDPRRRRSRRPGQRRLVRPRGRLPHGRPVRRGGHPLPGWGLPAGSSGSRVVARWPPRRRSTRPRG